jgi:hypothetical protein
MRAKCWLVSAVPFETFWWFELGISPSYDQRPTSLGLALPRTEHNTYERIGLVEVWHGTRNPWSGKIFDHLSALMIDVEENTMITLI